MPLTSAEKARRWRAAHPGYRVKRKPLTAEQVEKKREATRKWRRTHKLAVREYVRDNAALINTRRRTKYKLDPAMRAASLARTQAWRQRNPERVREYTRSVMKARRRSGEYSAERYKMRRAARLLAAGALVRGTLKQREESMS